MHMPSSRLVILAFAGALCALTPAIAAPQNMGPGKTPGGIDCSLPENAYDPFCLQAPGKGPPPGPGNKGPGPGMGNPGPGPGPGKPGTGGPGYNQGGGPGGNGYFNWSQQERNRFHQRFSGFNFGFFPAPGFTITLGFVVPHSYFLKLRPVPRSIYRYYPQFRGYLYFVGRQGSVVIVSPRSHRIVAVL